MSDITPHPSPKKVRAPHLLQFKRESRPIVMMTAYDAITARWAEAAGVDSILVGDSLANTALGHRDTIPMTVDAMLHHCAAVARATTRPFLIGDLPFMSYKISPAQALAAAGRFVQEGGMEAIKLEGGAEVAPAVAAIVAAGIPVVGHLGLLPQSVHALGGYRTVGADDAAADRLRRDARALQEAGVCALVLEKIPHSLATELSRELAIPTVGIAAGPGCDGQVLVIADVLAMTPDPPYEFVKQYARLHEAAAGGLRAFAADVRERRFPPPEPRA
jgi:3-methyl-2-oxobutanoate hydroxymethyltransferase